MKKPSGIGAICLPGGGGWFTVWAPRARRMEVRLVTRGNRTIPMEEYDHGYHSVLIPDAEPGDLYWFVIDGNQQRPDPASRRQPQGVHGPSAIAASEFTWGDAGWQGPPLADYIFYELHVGTFTPEGTFDAIVPHLDGLRDLGVTAIELMPVAAFPGARNWGYDGVFPWAVQETYGGPEGLKRLVNACHAKGLALVLDVVYNHLGPEGNYLSDFGPYFTDRYRTPWGAALNFDGLGSDEVRRFFIDNAVTWLMDFHIDALRLDALHAIVDNSAYTFIEELAETFHAATRREGRNAFLIGESTANNARLVRPRQRGGLGIDAQWNDDFHHALHVLLTGEQGGYYADFDGRADMLATAVRQGFVYTGQYSRYRDRRHGTSSRGTPPERFVVFSQNHDQVGNRAACDRLCQSLDFPALKAVAATVLLSPNLPLLFMGEEYGEPAPFPYFVSHSDPDLVKAVREGRQREFASFGWRGEILDPEAEATFLAGRLDRTHVSESWHPALYAFYRECLRLRKTLVPLDPATGRTATATAIGEKALLVERETNDVHTLLVVNLGVDSVELALTAGPWRRVMDAAEGRWQGPGSSLPPTVEDHERLQLGPWDAALYLKEM